MNFEQQDECTALLSIYEDFGIHLLDTDTDALYYRIFMALEPENVIKSTVAISIFCPTGYPQTEPPSIELKESYGNNKWITHEHVEECKSELMRIYEESKIDGIGSVMLFQLIEFLREYLQDKFQENSEVLEKKTGQSQEVSEASVPLEQTAPPFDVFHSAEPLVDRKSVFVAHCAKCSTEDQVKSFMNYLKSNSKIAKATHNILAYRLVKKRNDTSKVKIQDSIVIQDYDDDGETAAGGRLLKLLENCGCENVAVVASRWYGGVKLGPDRFKDINTVARDLLEKHGFIKGAK